MNHEDLEFLFITIIESDPKLKYEGYIPAYKWDEPLVINDKKINDVYWDGDKFNIVWYNEYGEPESLEYYKRENIIKPNRKLIELLL
jgi:hypothetical protein